MNKELKIFYSKSYKSKWFIALAILSCLYLSIFIFFSIEILFVFHLLTLVYLVLIIISLLKPYLHIKDNTIKSGHYKLTCLKLDKLMGVFIVNGDYVFREKKKSLYIDLDLVSPEDKAKVLAYLEEKELLKSNCDAVKGMF